MSTKVRPNISEKNEYWIDRHRYYELKHFCLQYPIWKKAYASLDSFSKMPDLTTIFAKTNQHGDPTARCAEAREYYSERISMIESAAKETDRELWNYILKAVTEELSYTYLKTRLGIPCCRDTYYKLYRRFFWILNNTRK